MDPEREDKSDMVEDTKPKKLGKRKNIVYDPNERKTVKADPLENKKASIVKSTEVMGIKKVEVKKRAFKSFSHPDKKLKSIQKDARENQKLTRKAKKDVQILLTQDEGYLEAEGVEKTYNYTQEKIKKEVDLNTQKRIFNLKLTQFGPYYCQYNREGSNMLIAGQKGHLAVINAFTHKLVSEINVQETIRDIKFIADDMFAVAQKKYLYIYDSQGIELHNLRCFKDVEKLEYLPYHFLLVNSSRNGIMAWQDISTGEIVIEHPSKLGKATAMRQNPYNAIVHTGYSNGQVALWSPNITKPLVRMLCHQGAVTSVCVDYTGRYMVTTGMDSKMNVWDLRTYKLFSSYYTPTPASSLDISQKGLVSVGMRSGVHIWKDVFVQKQKRQYMREHYIGMGYDLCMH